ncbi:DNA-binding FadR family transcriptional regulator [Mucilaginibacter frigoritolerans]|uniref:DNA-binding FadR family transcriptional regulator n=1 Tax=Mucilaginibacter frigoritolerans TaxID=652788 RepID=A0A562UDJ7_9SPHI|nr:FadR/GntR family transcriptional regulator [Mucilaginibacter frigoritolerans]TWJ03385.1 DNA-binding FadR family transcriptional regulator [Mucilaginibacter frigoritolerans]
MAVKEKLSERITNQIRQDISKGKYPPNEKIPAEPELMKLYGVGRSTIREAIKSLSISGILKVQQGSGTMVNERLETESIDQKLKNADFDDIHAVRILLEGEMVKLAAINHTDEQIKEMEKCLEDRKLAILAEQPEQCANADIAFHTAIARASKNKVLAGLYTSFTTIIRDFFSRREAQGISHFAMSHHLHEELFKAIKAKKQKQAQQIILQILDNSY